MFKPSFKIKALASKLIFSVGLVLFASIFFWSYFTIKYQEQALIDKKVSEVDKFCNTALQLTWFAMFHNPNKDLHQVLKSLSDYNEIEAIKIFDWQGRIKFSNNPEEINTIREKTDIACKSCHSNPSPTIDINIKDRIRMFESDQGIRLIGIINPIINKPSCSNAQCHYHPPNINKLGTLDIVVSMEEIKDEVYLYKKLSAWTIIYLFITLGITIYLSIFGLVTHPIKKLISKTDLIGKGNYQAHINGINQKDEIGQLSVAINDMGQKIQNKQDELNTQKEMFQNLFDQVPCTITVQNRDYKLIEFNKEFSKKFQPKYGDHCFWAYKNLNKKCNDCPVERTFIDGESHFSEESGINKDGSVSHWFVKTAPLKDKNGKIVAAMEMSIDISQRKKLEEIVLDSEQKYQAIFKGIPNPVFILDIDTYQIMNCNDSALSIYDYTKEELQNKSFDLLFPDKKAFEKFIININKPNHERLINHTKNRERLYVKTWVSPAEFSGQKVLLVTVVDITLSVETEQQLIQAGKMATLGEMATGVAHELNQPLSVIKTASSFISKKILKKEVIATDILATLSKEIETHVDRASKITNHMRLFGRKSTLSKQDVNINETIKRAFDIFSQQLKLREINVHWDLDDNLPKILADPVKLEQVFINLLLNARDSIVTRFKKDTNNHNKPKQISISTSCDKNHVIARISDSGTGISETCINKIFEPFFTTKKVGEGTGLGLSISYGIIKESNGDIKIKNNPENGVTFTIRFRIDQGIPND